MTAITNSGGGPSVSVDFEGIPGAAGMLRDAAARGEDMRPPLEQIKGIFIEGHRAQFSSHGGYLGTPWPENSPETLARKSRKTVASLSGLMVEEGALEEALSGGKGSRNRVTKGSVSVGVSLFEALFAQGGAAGARRGVEPARPVLGIGFEERDLSVRILIDYLLGR